MNRFNFFFKRSLCFKNDEEKRKNEKVVFKKIVFKKYSFFLIKNQRSRFVDEGRSFLSFDNNPL